MLIRNTHKYALAVRKWPLSFVMILQIGNDQCLRRNGSTKEPDFRARRLHATSLKSYKEQKKQIPLFLCGKF
jgi:hypothetical protein